MKISKIILYDEPSVSKLDLKNIQQFIRETFGINSEIRENIFKKLNEKKQQKIEDCIVLDLKKPFQKQSQLIKDISTDAENMKTSKEREISIYDGIELNQVIEEIVPFEENIEKILHIIFTDKLIGTFDYDDYRYHARVWVGSNPIVISTTGIIEAPAKPKQYYIDLMTNFSNELEETIREKYKGEFLEYNDPRLPKIIEGYLIQSIMYCETGDVFCNDVKCRLFNAHWQKDLLISQIKNPSLCDQHTKILTKIKNSV